MKKNPLPVLKSIGVGAIAFVILFTPVFVYKDRGSIHVVMTLLAGLAGGYLAAFLFGFYEGTYSLDSFWKRIALAVSVLVAMAGEITYVLEDSNMVNQHFHGIAVYMSVTMPFAIAAYCLAFYIATAFLDEDKKITKFVPYITFGGSLVLGLIFYLVASNLKKNLSIFIDVIFILSLLMIASIIFMIYVLPAISHFFLMIFSKKYRQSHKKGGSASSSSSSTRSSSSGGSRVVTSNDIFHALYGLRASSSGAEASITSVSATGRGTSYAGGYSSFDINVDIKVRYDSHSYSTQDYIEKSIRSALSSLDSAIVSRLNAKGVGYSVHKNVTSAPK